MWGLRQERAGSEALRTRATCLGLLLCLRKKVAEEPGLRLDGGHPEHPEVRELGQVSRSWVSCWEKQPLGSQQVAWKARLVPEKMCTPEEVCLRGPSRAPGREGWKWTVATAVPRNQALSTG